MHFFKKYLTSFNKLYWDDGNNTLMYFYRDPIEYYKSYSSCLSLDFPDSSKADDNASPSFLKEFMQQSNKAREDDIEREIKLIDRILLYIPCMLKYLVNIFQTVLYMSMYEIAMVQEGYDTIPITCIYHLLHATFIALELTLNIVSISAAAIVAIPYAFFIEADAEKVLPFHSDHSDNTMLDLTRF